MFRLLWCAAFAAVIGLPVSAQEGANEERQDYACGKYKLAVWTVQDYEQQHVVVWFRNPKDKVIHPSVTAPGTFVSLCKSGVFFLLDNTGAHFTAGPSWLISANGTVLGRYQFDAAFRHGVTADEALVWVQSTEGTEGAWVTRLTVIDKHGARIYDRTYKAATNQKIDYEGRTYEVAVEEPVLPY